MITKNTLSLYYSKIFTLSFSIILLLSSCTTIGFHKKSIRNQIDFGNPETLRVCFFKEPDVTQKDIDKIVSAWNKELNLYNISLENAKTETIKRPGFFNSDVFFFLFTQKLQPPCDRMVYLRGRTFKDFAFEFVSIGFMLVSGLKLETYGAVETITNSRGFIRARYMQLFQSIFTSPKSTMVHEGYHLLGCGHSLTKTKCYAQIRKLKYLMQTADHENDFFPILTERGKFLSSRDAVNFRMLNYIKQQNQK